MGQVQESQTHALGHIVGVQVDYINLIPLNQWDRIMDQTEHTYLFLQKKHMTRDKFVDMLTAICMAHRDMFDGFSDDALDSQGNLKEEYCYGTTHVIACMIAQRCNHGCESEVPMDELRLRDIDYIPLEDQRTMVEKLLQCYE